ncbi:MAG: caspase family protein [Candidatus Accumulibacter sp.]|uniref:caspase family protein n=1 Tax=Accumulibacter sp. TaxID=2053492 RepID=UPI0025888B32|nr:caspase family protein [Accumulibacter sp.]MCM8622548.1 caspase family protein [Accumulibacter sp.]
MSRRFENAYALLIAVDRNREAAAALPAVATDARALYDVLVHPQRCAYRPGKVRLLTGAESSRQGILAGLDWLAERVADDDDATAIVYFSGHGHEQDGEHFLIPYDLDLKQVGQSAVAATTFATRIARLAPHRLLVLLDCCHAGGMGVKDTLAATALHSAALPPTLFLPAGKSPATPLAQGEGRAVLSSCRPGQLSYLRADGRMSIFTYHLIEALSGHAQAAGGATGVLVSDLIGHLHRRVPESARADHGAVQTPWPELRGNFPVALLLGGEGLAKGQRLPDPLALPASGAVSYRAKLRGGGAIAQGDGATALGKGATLIGGKKRRRGDTETMREAPATVDDVGPARERSSSKRFRALFAERGFAFLDDGDGRDVFRLPYPTGRTGKGIADGSSDEAPQEKAQASAAAGKLGFVLEGPAARGLTLLAEGIALLVFKQFAAGDAAGAIVEGEKLEPLLAGEQTLAISVTPEDGLAIDGPHSRQAQFKDGRLQQAQPFALRALAGSAGEYGVHVEFHHAGARLYEFRLPIIVLPPGKALPAVVSPTIIDLDGLRAVQDCAEVGKPPLRRLRLKACFENNLLYLDLEDYVDGEFSNSVGGFTSSIDRARLDALRAQLAATLGANLYETSSVWYGFDGTDTTAPACRRALTGVARQFAQAGGVLYRALREDPTFCSVLDYIEGRAEPGTRLTIVTRDVSLPWELLYPQRFDADAPDDWPLQPELFWGTRFALETQFLGEGDYASLLKARRQAKATASLNLNPTITVDADQPRKVHDALAAALRAQGPTVEVNADGRNIRDVVVRAKTDATLIYLFCHGSPPPSPAAPRPESLELDNGCSVSVDQIDEQRVYRNAPVIFLNACSAGAFSPLSFTGFLRAFRRKKALGLIAPSFPVPTGFAARFGADVVDACFHSPGRSLAGLLLGFRQQHVRRGNPLPLLYAVQCQLDL